ncbi:MAG TPA: hypothetical protein DCM45_05110 [Clostridiales bacterium]|nr:hypothetical protein [Clostridiales bacterium]
MKRTLYIHDKQSGSPILRRLLIILLTLALIGGSVVGYYIMVGERRASTILDDFRQALADGQYTEAIELYRVTQAKALTDSWVEQYKDKYQAALQAMEKQIDDQVSAIQSKLLINQRLSAGELSFAEDMAEASAVRLISFLRKICTDYLDGRLERNTLENAFGQLASLTNLKESIGGLPGQFDAMTVAQPQIIAAYADLADAQYWAAWQIYKDLAEDEKMIGFVQDLARQRLADCEKVMYQPLLEKARTLMAGGRYLSARDALEKMAAVYKQDETVSQAIDVCSSHLPIAYASYNGTVEVITIKPLIIRPDLAFDDDRYAAAANDTMLTTHEFRVLLDELYANNYILIDASRLYTADRKRASLQLPVGKKPIILVIDGLNYYASRRQTGNCWDLVFDEGGEVSGLYQDISGQMIVDREAEAIGLLDTFVTAHPDFSHDGAKGTISLTGYECLFGKIIDEDQLDDRNLALADNGYETISPTADEIAANREEARNLIDRLLQTGWQFASSSYGFIDIGNSEFEKIKADHGKWQAQIGSLTRPVEFFNYPSGSILAGSDERAIWLREQGFILFGGLGTTAYLYAGNGYIYVDKTPINGFTLRNAALYKLGRLFDADKVYDEGVR